MILSCTVLVIPWIWSVIAVRVIWFESPSNRAQGKTRRFHISSYFLAWVLATVKITTVQWIAADQAADTWFHIAVGHVMCPTQKEVPLINPLLKTPHWPGKGIIEGWRMDRQYQAVLPKCGSAVLESWEGETPIGLDRWLIVLDDNNY